MYPTEVFLRGLWLCSGKNFFHGCRGVGGGGETVPTPQPDRCAGWDVSACVVLSVVDHILKNQWFGSVFRDALYVCLTSAFRFMLFSCVVGIKSSSVVCSICRLFAYALYPHSISWKASVLDFLCLTHTQK